MTATRVRDHASALWLPIFNASGSRMDAAFDGAVPLYMDRAIILELLHPLVNGPASKDNVLEKFLCSSSGVCSRARRWSACCASAPSCRRW